jgi:hypothetical protein
MNIDDYAKELCSRMWITKGSRYNAYRRYEWKHRLSLTSISMLTLYVFGLTLADFCHILRSTGNNNIISFISMVLSIFILILSLLENSNNYQIKAERLHNCAKEITGVYNELRMLMHSEDSYDYKFKELEEITKRYDGIIQKYGENHDKIDYELFQSENYKEFEINLIRKKFILIKSLKAYWLYIICILLPPMLFIYILLRQYNFIN